MPCPAAKATSSAPIRSPATATTTYRREGGPSNPHDHSELVKCIRGGADSTDGIEATSRPLGTRFPAGLVVAMNSGPRNFLIFKWEDFWDAGQSLQ